MARYVVTGGAGFVGRWLERELKSAGNEVVIFDIETDVRDANAFTRALRDARPDAVVHLAAVSFAPDAAADAGTAYAIAISGTANLLEAARRMDPVPAVLVTGSSDVYGIPQPDDLPLTETSALRATRPYGISKIAQESTALAYAGRYDLPVVVTRSFNHVGPGQRPDFVVPAIAQRVFKVARGEERDIPVGNLDVRRDIGDVRDVVRAYRVLVEGLLTGRLAVGGSVYNVCTGNAVSIREMAEQFCRLAGVEPDFNVDPRLVRADDPPEIRGAFGSLQAATGWQPQTPLAQTLSDIWNSLG